MTATQNTSASDLDSALNAPAPSPAMRTLDRLVGEWAVKGGVNGTVRYEWMHGRHFLLQHVDFEHAGEQVTGLEVIGHLHPLGHPVDTDIVSRFYDSTGNTLDYAYELDGDILTIWEGHRGSGSYFRGELTDGDTAMAGEWIYEGGGGYASTMTRL
jgi:hypothetical protein